MCHSSAVGILTFALCLVASWSASAEVKAPTITVQEATTAVNAAKQSAEEVFEKAQSEVNKAKPVLARLETFATEAQNTEGMAAEAESKVEKEAKDNKDAKDIVNNIKSISLKVGTFLTTAKKNLNTADTSLTTALQRATTLKTESNIEIPDTETTEGQYSTIANTASGLRLQAEAVDKDIIAAIKLINKETATADTMEESVKEAKVANLHLSVIVAVAKIQTMMHEADSIIRNTQNKKNEVDKIVQDMQTLRTTTKSESNEDINELCRTAEGELTKATNAVAKVTIEKEAMSQQKQLAEVALTEVNKATEIEKAQPHVATATSCLDKVKGNLAQLRIALQTAKNSVAKTNDLMQKFKTALSTTTTALTPEEVKEAENSDIPVQGKAEADQKDTTIQPTITDTEQPSSKELPSQGNNSTQEIKDALINSAQSVPKNALTGGKAPALGAKNDSAMTVSVPLLVALIASAVLQ